MVNIRVLQTSYRVEYHRGEQDERDDYLPFVPWHRQCNALTSWYHCVQQLRIRNTVPLYFLQQHSLKMNRIQVSSSPIYTDTVGKTILNHTKFFNLENAEIIPESELHHFLPTFSQLTEDFHTYTIRNN